ncbi:uncharacterized protein [Eurosta solidaginis]|uniref:uncharacterized protein n=1 Tax=Eurosta solidaginis TaxID=178769 RepID=UPI0035309023
MGGRSKGRTNAFFLNNSRIQKEQLQLCKIELELEKILRTVNEAINELKVEELQLKAGAAAALSENFNASSLNGGYTSEKPSTSYASSLSFSQIAHGKHDDEQNDDVINRQIIDLEMGLRRHNVEEEDEDM